MPNAFHYSNTFDDTLAAQFKGVLSMGFDPRQMDDLRLWLDASNTSTILKNENNRVSRWFDRSGNNKHATQDTLANQPLFVENSFNGKSSIEAADVHFMLMPHFENISSAATVFAVMRMDQNNSANTWGNMVGINFDSTNAERQPLIYFTKGNPNNMLDISAGNMDALTYGTTNGLSDGSKFITTYKTNGSTLYSYLNSGQMKSASVVFSKAGGISRILGGAKGNLAELIIYGKFLDDQKRKQVEAYLSAKWNIAIQA